MVEHSLIEFLATVGIVGKVGLPPWIPTIPTMFFCEFGTFQAQILRWLRLWILARTDATNADF